jgi:hypothetical protein
MPKRSSKRDENQIATEVLRPAIGEPWKNPAAVALGRLGGLKGGKARSKALSSDERTRIARKAAAARWKKR